MRRYLWYGNLALALTFTAIPAGTIMASGPHGATVSKTPAYAQPAKPDAHPHAPIYLPYKGTMVVGQINTHPATSAPSNAFTPLQGGFTSVRNGDGRLEMFADTNDGNIWHKWQSTPNDDTSWSGWSWFGSGMMSPEAQLNMDGRVEVFAVDKNGKMWHIWQTAVGGPWSAWTAFAQNMWMKTSGAGYNTGYTVIQNMDGRVEVFAPLVNLTTGAVQTYHIWQTTAGGSWGAWTFLFAGNLHQLVSGMDKNGAFEVFGNEGFGTTYTAYTEYQLFQTAAGSSWGTNSKFGTGVTNFTLNSDTDGRLEAFAQVDVSGNWQVYHTWQTTPGTWNNSGSGIIVWQATGFTINSAYGASVHVLLNRNASGTLEIFAYSSDLVSIYHNYQTTAGGSWATWSPFLTQMSISALYAAQEKDGHQSLFAIDGTGTMWQTWQTSPAGTGWHGWVNVGHP